MTTARLLTALDGSNPLAFLTALGTLRLLQTDLPGVTLSWARPDVWRPELSGLNDSEDALCERIHNLAQTHLPVAKLSEFLGKNITVTKEIFASFARDSHLSAIGGDRGAADFAAAFGCELCEQDGKDRIDYTDFCFITGSGHQHFIGTMEGLKVSVTPDRIRDALFGKWIKNKGLSMRWDPADAAEYAFRWSDPSGDGASAVWGSNLLAIHALPLFPTQPTRTGLRTTAFREGKPWPEFSWPIWTHPVGLDTVRSLLSLAELHSNESKLNRSALQAVGIEELYRSPRVRIGQGANFKVSFRPGPGSLINPMRKSYLVCYDISDDKRLRKVFRVMRAYGDHLQYSVFECQLRAIDLVQLKSELGGLINHDHDQILFVDLGPADGRGDRVITALGKPYTTLDAPCIIV